MFEALRIEDIRASSEVAFKFVRFQKCLDRRTWFGCYWRFCSVEFDHKQLVKGIRDEPLSAGCFFEVKGKVSFPEDLGIPNGSETLKLKVWHLDYKFIPLLLKGYYEVLDERYRKYITGEFRKFNDPSFNRNEGS